MSLHVLFHLPPPTSDETPMPSMPVNMGGCRAFWEKCVIRRHNQPGWPRGRLCLFLSRNIRAMMCFLLSNFLVCEPNPVACNTSSFWGAHMCVWHFVFGFYIFCFQSETTRHPLSFLDQGRLICYHLCTCEFVWWHPASDMSGE